MKLTRVLPAAVILAIALVSAFGPLRAQSVSRPPKGGAYTVAQAAAGAQLYSANCSACHGAALQGLSAPPLVGDPFTSQFTGEPADDVNTWISTYMPLAAPGSLKPAEYLALMAYILQQNKYPAGDTPLTKARLKSIKIHAPPN